MKKYLPYLLFLCAILLIALMVDANKPKPQTVFDQPIVKTLIHSGVNTLAATYFPDIFAGTPTPIEIFWEPDQILLLPLGTPPPLPSLDETG